MQINTLLKELTERLSNLIPPNFATFKSDFKKNIQAILESTFAKLDIVTREEFDVQSKVLARTRQKVEALERQVQQLEQQLSDNKHA